MKKSKSNIIHLLDSCHYIDSHIHFQLSTCQEDESEIQNNKIFSLSNGLIPQDYEVDTQVCNSSDYIISCPGLHPWYAKEASVDSLIEAIKQHESPNNPIPMIGEIGLDYTWIKDSTTYPQMKQNFYNAIELARSTDRSVTLHTKGAEYEIEHAMRSFGRPYLVHWYSGPKSLISPFLNSGAFFSFGVEQFYTPYIRELCRLVPISRILPETDNPVGIPWYTGEFASGKSVYRKDSYPESPPAEGRPMLIQKVYNEIGRIKKLDYNTLHQQFKTNMRQLISK